MDVFSRMKMIDPIILQALGVVAVSMTCIFLYRWLQDDVQSKFWKSQHKVGVRGRWFSWTLATIRSLKGTKEMAVEGYQKYSKHDLPYVLPSADRGPMVVIPPAHIRNIYNLPESELAAHETQHETIQAYYTVRPELVHNNFHNKILGNQLTRGLGALTPALVEELALGFEQHWGRDEHQWKDVVAWHSCMKIVSSGANRIFIGKSLCRNQELLEDLRAYAMGLFAGASLINLTPVFLRPLVGRLVCFNVSRLATKCLKRCYPTVEERLQSNKRRKEDPSNDWIPPADGLQWVIDEAYKAPEASSLDPVLICHRFLNLNFVSMHSTSFTITNTILDLYSSADCARFVKGLREEHDRVLKEAGGEWTKEAVNKLYRADSAIRESMRMSSFGIVALPRRVSARNGLKMPNGTVLPHGTQTVIPMEQIHYDESNYASAASYNAFRFCEEAAHDGTKPKSGVTLDESFVSFGYGKHACPGRFFALHEMKLMLTHLVAHYDVQPLKERPIQYNLMWLKLPSEKATIRVRRRARR